MRRSLFALLFLLFAFGVAQGQPPNLGPVAYQNYVPTGTCILPNNLTIVTGGIQAGVYQCKGTPLTWQIIGAGSSSVCPLKNATNLCITEPPYNMVGDGIVDNTAAFLAAFAAIAATPGKTGTLWGPDGAYKVGTTLLDTGCANAVLPLPKLPNYVDNTLVDISIKGFTLPSWNTNPSGFIIKSALTTGNLIGGCNTAVGGGFPNFTNAKLEMENVTINLPANTGAVAVNASNILAFQGRHLLISTPGSGTTIPTTASGGGIFMPQIANEVQNELDDVNIGGVYTPYKITEHTHAKRIYAQYSHNCFVFDNGTTSASIGDYEGNGVQVDYLWEQNCVNGIVGGSGPFHSPLHISLADLENLSGNGVLDTSNTLYGIVNINVPSTFGSTSACSANISGASHLAIHYINCQPDAGASGGGTPSGLIENWLSQEGQGSTLVNSGYDFLNPATAANVTWSSGITGFAGKIATYNGTSSIATAASATSTAFDGTTPFSGCVWANLISSTPGGTFVSTLDGGSNFKGWEFSLNNGTTGHLSFFLVNTYPSNAIAQLQTGTVSTGATHLYCFTYNGSRSGAGVTFYIDGVVSPSAPTIDNLTASTANTIPVSLGARPGGSSFLNGYQGRVRVVNRLLSATEVSSMFAAGSSAY